MILAVMASVSGWASVAGRALVPAWTPEAGTSARPTPMVLIAVDAGCASDHERWGLSLADGEWEQAWSASGAALSQRERKQRQTRAAPPLINSRPSAAMARGSLTSPLAVPRSAGCGAGAQRSMRASCADSLRLSERRERSEQSEFRSAAPRTSIAGCPQRSAGTRPVGPPFFCLLFFGGAKKSRSPAGANSRPTAHPHHEKAIKSIAFRADETSASAPKGLKPQAH